MKKDVPNRFKDWFDEISPKNVKIPLNQKKLDTMPFQKLLDLRSLCHNRMIVTLSNFIRKNLPIGDVYMDIDSKNTFKDVLEKAIEYSKR